MKKLTDFLKESDRFLDIKNTIMIYPQTCFYSKFGKVMISSMVQLLTGDLNGAEYLLFEPLPSIRELP